MIAVLEKCIRRELKNLPPKNPERAFLEEELRRCNRQKQLQLEFPKIGRSSEEVMVIRVVRGLVAEINEKRGGCSPETLQVNMKIGQELIKREEEFSTANLLPTDFVLYGEVMLFLQKNNIVRKTQMVDLSDEKAGELKGIKDMDARVIKAMRGLAVAQFHNEFRPVIR